jgi:hypothetical protein
MNIILSVFLLIIFFFCIASEEVPIHKIKVISDTSIILSPWKYKTSGGLAFVHIKNNL